MGAERARCMTEVRLIRAKRLLRSTDMTVAETARRVGYGSEASFSRAFKAGFGEPPSALRKRQNASSVLDR